MGIVNNIGGGGGVIKGCGNQQMQRMQAEQCKRNNIVQQENEIRKLRQETKAEERKRMNLERRKRDFLTHRQMQEEQAVLPPSYKKRKIEDTTPTQQPVEWNAKSPFSLTHTQRRKALSDNYSSGGYRADTARPHSLYSQDKMQKRFALTK
jgi:membrane protein involved in colicin uptake